MFHFDSRERTLAAPVVVVGRGYWSGQQVSVKVHPAPSGSGRYFVRDDLPHAPVIPALIDYRVSAQRRTVLARQGARVEMVEHLLAALYGMGVDNCAIHIDSEELPGLDGSAGPYVDAIQSVGLEFQRGFRRFWSFPTALLAQDGQASIEARPSSEHRLEYHLHFASGPIANQSYISGGRRDDFISQLSRSRTFLTRAEADQIQAAGLARHVTASDLLIFGDKGLIDNTLRSENECARHKALDVLGDLSLCGFYWCGAIVAHGSGHSLNASLAAQIVKQARASAMLRAS